MPPDRRRARAPKLLAISDRRELPDQMLQPWLADLGAAGVPAIQLREKDLDDRALLELARAARALLPPPQILRLPCNPEHLRSRLSDDYHQSD